MLPGDPVFARIFDGALADLVERPRSDQRARNGTTVVFGPGSALHAHDRLWYADIPKSLSLERIRKGLAGNVGQSSREVGSEQRLLFVDWPMLDRHKQMLLPRDRSLSRRRRHREPRARSEATRFARRSGPSRRGHSASGRPSCPGRGVVSGYDAGSGFRLMRRISRGPTS